MTVTVRTTGGGGGGGGGGGVGRGRRGTLPRLEELLPQFERQQQQVVIGNRVQSRIVIPPPTTTTTTVKITTMTDDDDKPLTVKMCPRRPLSQYLNTGDYQSLSKNRGEGIRRFYMGKCCDASFEPDFLDKVKEQLDQLTIKFREQCPRPSRPPSSSIADADPLHSSRLSCERPATAVVDVVDASTATTTTNVNLAHTVPVVISIPAAVPVEKPPVQPPVQRQFKDIVRDYLENPSMIQVEIEGTMVNRESLIGWALQLKSHTVPKKSFRVQSTQTTTEDPPVEPLTAAVVVERQDACVDTQDLLQGPVAGAALMTSPPPPPLMTTAPPALMATPPPPLMAISPYLFPVSPQQIPPPAPRPQQQQVSLTHTPRGYERAKNWRPATPEQRAAFEQARLDICQMLVVGKGCRLKSVFSEFHRVTQETLDLGKLGIPDLKTLLVQMQDLIVLKKERYTEMIYVYPNLQASEYEAYAHIADLVAHQRDPLQVIPDPNVLPDYDIRQLFENRHNNNNLNPSYGYAAPAQNFQSSFLGSSSWRNNNGNNYYGGFNYPGNNGSGGGAAGGGGNVYWNNQLNRYQQYPVTGGQGQQYQQLQAAAYNYQQYEMYYRQFNAAAAYDQRNPSSSVGSRASHQQQQ